MEPDLGPVGEIAPAAPLPADAPATFSSEREAARAMSAARRAAEQTPPAESAKPPEAATAEEPDLAKADADLATEPSETEPETNEPEESLPPIERPRSWAKELDEEWSSYPREAQERIARREQDRDAATRRAQNEAAEARKAAQAEREQAEAIRKQYEAKLPLLEKKIQTVGPFSDIQNMDDVRNLQKTDPFRFQEYQLYQWEMAAEQVELKAAQERQAQEHQTNWAKHVQEENQLAAEYIPDLADKVKGAALTQRVATELLPDLGFKDSELADLANGKTKLSIYDHRIQRLLADALKLRDIQNAPKAVAPKNLPPVARPGTAPSPRASSASKIQALQKQLDNATGLQAIRLSAELLRARRG